MTHEDVEGEGEGDDEDGEDEEGLDEGREDLLEHHHVEAVQVEPGQRKQTTNDDCSGTVVTKVTRDSKDVLLGQVSC